MLKAATSWCKLDTCVSSLSTDDLVLCISKLSPSKESALLILGVPTDLCLSILSLNSLCESRCCPSDLKIFDLYYIKHVFYNQQKVKNYSNLNFA